MRSLRSRMTALFVGGQAILLAFVIAGLLWWSQAQSETYAQHALVATAGRLIHDADGDNLQDSLDEEFAGLQIDHLSLDVWDGSGRLILHSGPTLPPHPDMDDWRVYSFMLTGRHARLAYPWAPVERALHREAELLGFLAMVVLLTGSAGAWVLVGRSLAPIATLCREVETSEAALEGTLELPSQDVELVQLVSTLNGLLNRARQTLRLRGQFYATASHELRTPLQALSGHLELSLSRPRTSDEYRDALVEAQRQTARLSRLVRDLLTLTQLETAPLPPAEDVDVTDLCQEVIGRLQPVVAERGLKISFDTGPDLQVTAPPTHVEMLVSNLVENAIRYARPEGRVQVATSRTFRVFDECPVPEGWDPERLFEPFYRPTGSVRSHPQGTGLGLAICHALARANGWTLTLQAHTQGVEAVVDFDGGRPA